MSAEQQFRTALRGFHKQDVLDYIENAARAHSAQVEQLEKELAAARKASEQLSGEKAAAEKRAEEFAARNGELSENLSACAASLEKTKEELARRSAEAEQAAGQLAGLEERLAKAEPSAAAYESVKDRTAGIELEAHRRAQEIENAAREQVKKTKAELEGWMVKIQAGYDRLRTDVDATISHAAGELERVARSLGGVSGEFAEHDAALEGLLKAYRECLGPQAPTPLPLDGE